LITLLLIIGFSLSTSQADESLAQTKNRPNIVFILTDDLDVESTTHTPEIDALLAERGTKFKRAFVTTPSCCPSRSSILTGKYVHNHTVYTNLAPRGGASKFRSSGEEKSTIATRLNGLGYETVLIGKYLNEYDGTYVPPGWDEWRGQLQSMYKYNVNGKIKSFDPKGRYYTKLMGDWATAYIHRNAPKERPFFMYLSVKVPHLPATPEPRYENAFSRRKAPRPPSFNEADVSDKPAGIRNLPRLSRKKIAGIDEHYRDRLRTMLSVGDMVARLTNELRANGELDNTYIVFTSDHGYHTGQHRLIPGKGKPYEEDIRVPLIVRGPGVPANRTLKHTVLNIDFAPTFARLGGGQIPAIMDGRSFAPLLRSSSTPLTSSWRQSFLVEYFNKHPYSALHTGKYSYVEYPSGERELYDLTEDPYQLTSLHESSDQQARMTSFHTRLKALKNCSGQDSCKVAESDVP
jgi:arylsulfatase A-like enzyme